MKVINFVFLMLFTIGVYADICAPVGDRIRNLSTNPIPPFEDFNAPLGDQGCTVDTCIEYIVTACDGTKIRVQEWKNSGGGLNPSAKPVVMIHGFPHSHLIFARQAHSYLADNYRLITYDVRGQGSSEKPTDLTKYENQDYAGDLNDIITGLGLIKPVIVAHSYGGTIPIDYADIYGVSNLGGLVLVGAFTRLDFDGSGISAIEPPINSQVFVDAGPNLIPGLFSANLGFFIRESKHFVELSTNQPIPESEDILAYDTMTPVIARSGAFLARDVPMGDPFRDDVFMLKLATIPTFVIHSQYDRLIKYTHALDNYSLLNVLGKSKLWLLDDKKVGHTIQLEEYKAFNTRLNNFLQSLP